MRPQLLLIWTMNLCSLKIFANAILTKPVQYPSASSGTGNYASAAVVGILTGQNPGTWNPSEPSWNDYLNKECRVDTDCYPGRTLLYCMSYRCKCITQGATYLNGYFYNYNMIWNDTISQCVSQTGSPCTLKQFWFNADTLRMDCMYDNDCVEISSSTAKATLDSQSPSAYGSSLQGYPQGQRDSQYSQYYGSGVVGFSGVGPTQPQLVSRGGPGSNLGTSSSDATASTPSEINTWGICVPRGFHKGPAGLGGSNQASIVGKLPSEIGLYLCLLYVTKLALY